MNLERKLVFQIPSGKYKLPQMWKLPGNQLTPRMIQCYSVDSQRIFKANISEQKFLTMPTPDQYPIDLNTSDEAYNHAEYLDHMLYFVRHYKELMFSELPIAHTKLKANIITQHEVLETILCTLHKKTNWSILGTKYLNTVYLCLVQTDSKPEISAKVDFYVGMERRLKSYLYGDSPNAECKFSNNNGELHGVFECNIAGFSVVYNSVMGACDGAADNTGGKNIFKECKVLIPGYLKNMGKARDRPTLTQALIWWSECILKNVWHLHIAHPDQSGKVVDVQISSLDDIIIEKTVCNKCTYFLEDTLQHIYKVIELDNPDTVYQFDYEAQSKELFYSVSLERNENTFISDWYRAMLNVKTNE